MLLIGASGRARHGKTIFCEAIYKHSSAQGANARIYDIGQMIRLEAVEAGLLPAELQREAMERQHIQVLIDLGKERRKLSENYWVERLLYRAVKDNPDVALCPNLRLPMEAQAFRDCGGYVVRCTRLNANGSLFISEDRPPNDITETALEFWPADAYFTTIDGNADLMARMAETYYNYLCEKTVY